MSSNNKSGGRFRRPGGPQNEPEDVTERSPIPFALRYAPPPVVTAVPELAPEKPEKRRARVTPAPIEAKSNIIPFTRPNKDKDKVAMVLANPVKPASSLQPSPTPSSTAFTPASAQPGPSPVRAAVMVTQPAPGQSPVAAVFSQQSNGMFSAAVAVAMPKQTHQDVSMTQAMTMPAGIIPANIFPATQYPLPPSAIPVLPAPVPAPAAPAAETTSIVAPSGTAIAEAPHGSAIAVPAGQKWDVAAYEKLGLGEQALAKVHQKTSKLVVSAYRLLGFGILTMIVTLLIGYITESIFYFVSDSWAQPMIVSRNDEKVVQQESALAEQENNRDKIASDLKQAEEALAMQQAFQGEYAKAIRADMKSRKAALAKMRDIAHQYASARGSITGTNVAFAAQQARQLESEFRAGLVDQHAMMNGNFQSAQITSANLGLAEKQIDMEQKADDLEAQSDSLDAIVNSKDDAALSYDVLKIKQDYETSKLEEQKAIATRDALKLSLDRQDKLVNGIAAQGFLRAIKDDAQVAFVPYSNIANAKPGVNLYGCTLGMVICHKVGKVIEVLPGEIQQKHPHRDKMLRGQLVEIQLEDGDVSGAQDDVLFIGSKPMGI